MTILALWTNGAPSAGVSRVAEITKWCGERGGIKRGRVVKHQGQRKKRAKGRKEAKDTGGQTIGNPRAGQLVKVLIVRGSDDYYDA